MKTSQRTKQKQNRKQKQKKKKQKQKRKKKKQAKQLPNSPPAEILPRELRSILHQKPKISKCVLHIVTGAKLVAAGAVEIVGKFRLEALHDGHVDHVWHVSGNLIRK
jgi:septum formation inhibitor MinC